MSGFKRNSASVSPPSDSKRLLRSSKKLDMDFLKISSIGARNTSIPVLFPEEDGATGRAIIRNRFPPSLVISV
ncbi:hypothetical protein D3C83_51010 [compost metagenome]